MNSTFLIRRATLEDVSELAALHFGVWQYSFRKIIADKFLDSLTLEQFKIRRARTIKIESLINLVALNQDQKIVGFSICGQERDENELYTSEVSALYVDIANQGKSIGKQLLLASVKELVRQGHDTLLIWTLKDNPACLFYSKCGGKVVQEQMIDIGEESYSEFAFGWENLPDWIVKWEADLNSLR